MTDEALAVLDDACICRCWMRCGQRTLIPALGSSDYLHIFGAYNWHSDNVDALTAPRKNSQAFIHLLEQLVATYPRQQLMLVMDNASYHHPP